MSPKSGNHVHTFLIWFTYFRYKKLQYDFPKTRGVSQRPFGISSKNSSDLVAGPFPNMVKNTLGQTCPSSKLNTALWLANMLTTPHREECMHEMDSSTPGAPTVMVVDAGDVFVGGRYHSLVPILRFGFLVLNHGTPNTRAHKKNKAFDWYSDL